MKSVSLFLIAAVVQAISFSALADDGSVSQITAQEAGATAFTDSLYANYFGIFHGAPIDNLSSPKTVNSQGAPSSTPVYFDSELTTAYMITPTIGLGLSTQFTMSPVYGQGLTMGDMGPKLFDKDLVHYKGLFITGNLYLQAPTNEWDRNNGMIVGVKTTPSIRYLIPNSRFAIGSWNEFKEYAGATAQQTFKIYTLPYVNYTVAQNFSLNLGYEMEWYHMVNTPELNFATIETDFQPGVVWNITKQINVNPYIQFFTNNSANTNKAAIGAAINARML